MSDTVIKKCIFLKTNPEEVWAFLTNPEKLEIWFHRPQAALKKGETYQMMKQSDGTCFMSGNVLEAQSPNALEYEFSISPMGDAVSVVNWSITQVAGGVELALTHTGLPQSEDGFGLILELDKGWDEHLSKMRESVNG